MNIVEASASFLIPALTPVENREKLVVVALGEYNFWEEIAKDCFRREWGGRDEPATVTEGKGPRETAETKSIGFGVLQTIFPGSSR